MNIKNIKDPKQMLLSLKQSYMERLAEVRSDIDQINAEMPSINEEVERSQLESRLIMLRQESLRLSSEITQTDNALKLVAEGEYGYCLDCGFDIDEERLEKRPQSTQCVGCQEIRERKSKQYAS